MCETPRKPAGSRHSRVVMLALFLNFNLACTAIAQTGHAAGTRNLLYVACPGVRNYLEYGGHGLLVFDIDQGHRWIKRIPLGGLDDNGQPINVKGVCASAVTGRIYVSTVKTLMCVDLTTEQLLWERAYEGGCDRMSMDPRGKFIYLPSFEGPHWNVVDAITGDVLAKLTPDSGAHNTLVGADGRFAYLAGLKSPLLAIADTSQHQIVRSVGPFAAAIRPFTLNAGQTRCYVCVNELLGFEIGDLTTGKKLARVEVPGFSKGKVKRHGCPSHGIGLTPDEREVWVVDAFNQRLHVFDNTVEPPKPMANIELRDEPGWITFSLDGRWAYPSNGQVIDTQSKRVSVQLTDEHDAAVQSEKMVQIVFQDGKPIQVGDQFGIGRASR
jgi:hypothetical protein